MTHPVVCAQCKDSSNPVSIANGKTFFTRVGGELREIAYVHTSCVEAWAQANGGTAVAALEPAPWPTGFSQMG